MSDKNLHDLAREEQEKARFYTEIVSATSFMRREAAKRYPDNLEAVLAEKNLPVCNDKEINDLITDRESTITFISQKALTKDAEMTNYADYEYSFEEQYNSDIQAVVDDYEKYSKLFIAIYKERWDEVSPTAVRPKITEIVSVDAELVYMINNITSMASNIERLNR